MIGQTGLRTAAFCLTAGRAPAPGTPSFSSTYVPNCVSPVLACRTVVDRSSLQSVKFIYPSADWEEADKVEDVIVLLRLNISMVDFSFSGSE